MLGSLIRMAQDQFSPAASDVPSSRAIEVKNATPHCTGVLTVGASIDGSLDTPLLIPVHHWAHRAGTPGFWIMQAGVRSLIPTHALRPNLGAAEQTTTRDCPIGLQTVSQLSACSEPLESQLGEHGEASSAIIRFGLTFRAYPAEGNPAEPDSKRPLPSRR